MKTKKELIRILRTQEGDVILDVTGRQNGRGAYLCRSMTCLEKAIRSKAVERSLKVPVSPETYDYLQKEMEKADEQ